MFDRLWFVLSYTRSTPSQSLVCTNQIVVLAKKNLGWVTSRLCAPGLHMECKLVYLSHANKKELFKHSFHLRMLIRSVTSNNIHVNSQLVFMVSTS